MRSHLRWIVLAAFIGSAVRASIPEPDAVLYGTVTLDGRAVVASDDLMVIARVDGLALPVGTYTMGENAAAGDQYVLRIRVESLADGSPRSGSAALIGETVRVYLKAGRGAEKHAINFTISERGISRQQDLVGATGDDCNGNQISDALDISSNRSKDCNQNGVPDECEPRGDLVGGTCSGGGGGGGGGGGTPVPVDTDGDGIPDEADGCPLDPAKTATGTCGCGVADADADADGVADCFDQCPGQDDRADTDGDGTLNCFDDCPEDAAKSEPGVCGCGQADADSDGDGVRDCRDNCPTVANPLQQDANSNGVGDACEPPPAQPDGQPSGQEPPGSSGSSSFLPVCGSGMVEAILVTLTGLCVLPRTRGRRR